jgi:hypothetical protein
MPDWLTHTLAGWITGKTTGISISLIVIGSLIPDLSKIVLAFNIIGYNTTYLFEPLSTPIGALLVAGIISLFFPNVQQALIPLSIGITTHLVLDFFLIHVTPTMKLFFPFSWQGWQIPLIYSEDYLITIYAIVIAAIVYLIFYYRSKKDKNKEKNGNLSPSQKC